MARRVSIEVQECPVCGAVQGVFGKPFLSSWAVALHIAGKAKNKDVDHQGKIVGWVPFVEFDSWTNNEIAEAIREFVEYASPERTAPHESDAGSNAFNELYDLVTKVERTLHSFVRRKLQEHFDADEEDWWVSGVPQKVRVACVTRREEDTRRDDPFNYTDFIHLKAILDENWGVFEQHLHSARSFFRNKNGLLDALQRLNNIRNVVMHPIRNQELISDDLEYVRRANDAFRTFVGGD